MSSTWQYARLIVIHSTEPWTTRWHAPDGTTEGTTTFTDVMNVVNQAGALGWEMVGVEGSPSLLYQDQANPMRPLLWQSSTTYYFKRPAQG